MKNLPDEVWIKIYEYEGLFYDLMKKVIHELKLITYQPRCYNCKLKNIDNNQICSTHWKSWQESVKYIKANPIYSNMTRVSNGMWIWNDVVTPDWLEQLRKKLNNKITDKKK
tara:strand:+ start:7912 stop:8247 length:336 start_codon:yes stop_codon:yes gene_type:complete